MKKLNLTDKRNPDYFYSEAIKTLRTNIQLSGQSIKTILVTSCYPNEGKSDIVLSLAQELGSIGKKVLLLDADIRKTAYAGRLGVEEEVKGLSQLLSGQVGLQEIIYSTNFPNMDIIVMRYRIMQKQGMYADTTSDTGNEWTTSVLDLEHPHCRIRSVIKIPMICRNT